MSARHSAPVIFRLCPSIVSSLSFRPSERSERGPESITPDHALLVPPVVMDPGLALRAPRDDAKWRHLIASGLTGEPTAPVIGIAGATNRNSYTPSAAQS